MAGAAEARHAPSLDGARDHRERPRILRDAERAFDRRRIVAVDDFGPRAERRRLRREMLPVLRRRDIVALAQRVAVEDGDHPAEALIGAEIHRFPDLSFARLAVADEAEDALRHAVDPRRAREPRRHRQALAQRPGRSVEERKAKHRIGMAVDRRPDLAQRHQVALRHRPALAVGLERDAEIGARGINDRHRVPLAQDQPVGRRIVGIGRRPAHHAVHQHRNEVRERQRGRRMAAARRRGGADREPPQVDCLGMKKMREIGHLFLSSIPMRNAELGAGIHGDTVETRPARAYRLSAIPWRHFPQFARCQVEHEPPDRHLRRDPRV